MKIKNVYITILLLLFIIGKNRAQKSLWKKVSFEKIATLERYDVHISSSEKQVYTIDLNDFKTRLASSKNKNNQIIEFPTLAGTLDTYTIKEIAVLAPELAKKYPMIKSYIAKNIKNPSVTARISIGTDGLHAAISNPAKETYFVAPINKNTTIYSVYARSSIKQNTEDIQCLKMANTLAKSTTQNYLSDGKLRTFKIAIVSSGEYADFHLAQQDIAAIATESVKKAAVLSAINTSMTRINGVFERDLGVRFSIVENNDNIIFLDKTTDGITAGNTFSIIKESQQICDATIGAENYDIGHVFVKNTIGVSGLTTTLGNLCVGGVKAQGISGSSSPVGDAFDIDLVAHEIGHQLGANHSFNNNCDGRRASSTAVEPGSGSTIMGYAGFCSPNIQNTSDDYFSFSSINEMWNLINNTATCATITNTNNSPPTANAGADYTIPKSTPFVLTGIGNDINTTDVLTYSWEQSDTEITSSRISDTKTAGPIFRSLSPNLQSKRYFPAIETVLKGDLKSNWEVLPSVSRTINFSFLVRDNNSVGGNFARDDMEITVEGTAGPFEITSQNTSETLSVNTTKNITWNVNKTNIAPINCQNVSIKFSSDGGQTFPTTLIASTPNDGSENITIPNIQTSTGRILVEAVNTIFYDINNADLTISKTASIQDATFTNFSIYPNPSNGDVQINFDVLAPKFVSIELFDLNGRRIQKREFYNTNSFFSEQLNFENTSKGLYLIKVSNGNKYVIQKLILK